MDTVEENVGVGSDKQHSSESGILSIAPTNTGLGDGGGRFSPRYPSPSPSSLPSAALSSCSDSEASHWMPGKNAHNEYHTNIGAVQSGFPLPQTANTVVNKNARKSKVPVFSHQSRSQVPGNRMQISPTGSASNVQEKNSSKKVHIQKSQQPSAQHFPPPSARQLGMTQPSHSEFIPRFRTQHSRHMSDHSTHTVRAGSPDASSHNTDVIKRSRNLDSPVPPRPHSVAGSKPDSARPSIPPRPKAAFKRSKRSLPQLKPNEAKRNASSPPPRPPLPKVPPRRKKTFPGSSISRSPSPGDFLSPSSLVNTKGFPFSKVQSCVYLCFKYWRCCFFDLKPLLILYID